MLGGLSLFSIFTLVIVISGIHTGIPLNANMFFFCKIVFLDICRVQLCVRARFEWRVGKDVKQSPFQIGVSLTMITHRLLVPNKGTQLRVFEQFIENNHDRGSWALHGELRQV
jgi:hypothetical protein